MSVLLAGAVPLAVQGIDVEEVQLAEALGR